MDWMYVDGKLVTAQEAKVSALDRGLLYAHGVFETMRSYGGHVFRLEEHYRRLHKGAAALSMTVPLSLRDLQRTIAAVLDRNGVADARLRLTVTAGPPPGDGVTVILFARPLADYPPHLYESGMAAVVSAVRRNETSPLAGVKSLSYLENLLARESALRHDAQEAILLNTRGLVAEGSASNVFLIRGEQLITPSVDSGALAGVTRGAVLELAPAAGLEPVQSEVELTVLREASEAFLTGSVMEVMPLTRLDGRPVGRGQPGPATQRLRRLYSELVLRETSAAPST